MKNMPVNEMWKTALRLIRKKFRILNRLAICKFDMTVLFLAWNVALSMPGYVSLNTSQALDHWFVLLKNLSTGLRNPYTCRIRALSLELRVKFRVYTVGIQSGHIKELGNLVELHVLILLLIPYDSGVVPIRYLTTALFWNREQVSLNRFVVLMKWTKILLVGFIVLSTSPVWTCSLAI